MRCWLKEAAAAAAAAAAETPDGIVGGADRKGLFKTAPFEAGEEAEDDAGMTTEDAADGCSV